MTKFESKRNDQVTELVSETEKENLKIEFNRWSEDEEEDFRSRYGDRFPTCHPDELAVRVPKRFQPLFAELEPQIIGKGNYLTEGLWFFPDNGEVLKLSIIG